MIISEDRKRELKNEIDKNQDLLLWIGISLTIGLLIAGINTWNYNSSQLKYQSDEAQTITFDQNAVANYTLKGYLEMGEITVDLKIENIEPETQLVVTNNGNEIKEISDSSPSITISSENFDKNNSLRIKKTNRGFVNQELTSVRVTGTTNVAQLVYVVLNLVALILVFSPAGYVKYRKYQRISQMEDNYPEFLRDLLQGVRAGMSLPQAVQNVDAGGYGALDDEIQKMSSQIEWGVPFKQVLENFADRSNSDLIHRSTDTIVQAYESGGDVEEILESVGDNIRSVQQLKEQRQSELYGEMITGYIVYLIFIGILIALTNFLLPNLVQATESMGGNMNMMGMGFGGGGGSSLQENITLYEAWFERLVYLQAIFTGLVVGKLAEGNIQGGFKHSAILFGIGYLAAAFFL